MPLTVNNRLTTSALNARETTLAGALRKLPRRSRSLREQVAETLRRAIVHGELPPGERLLEEELAEQLGMSRGPIREALRQLEQEGLVASFPYRGTVVAELWAEEVLEVLIPIRNTLEQSALPRALKRLTDADLEQLDALVAEMDEAARQGDLARVVELDMLFHRHFVERSEQFHSLQLWDMIAPRIRGVFYRMGPYHDTLGEIAEQHRSLLGVLRRRHLPTARRALREHIAERDLYKNLPRSEPKRSG